MSRCHPSIVLLAGFAVLALPIIVLAQTPPSTPPRAQNDGTPPPTYRPGLGDLMTMTVQPRHIKLALAGMEKNWPYAAYELHELEESFDRAARYWPQWRSVPIAQMMVSVTKDPMMALADAIKAGDAIRFNTAYGQLTAACNACHQAADRGVIVIKIPEASTFPDQDFRPVNP